MYEDDKEDDMKLAYYLEIGVVTAEGVDQNGEIIFAIHESAKELAPELWQAHVDYVDSAMIELYESGLMEVEYNENLEATMRLSEEGHRKAKELGLIEMDIDDIPND